MLPEFNAPEVLTYSMESIISEKFDSIITRMELSGRMKDFSNKFWAVQKCMVLFLYPKRKSRKRDCAMKTETYSEKKTNIKKRVNIEKRANKRDETEIIEALVWVLELDEPELKIIVDAAEEQGLHLLFKSFNGL